MASRLPNVVLLRDEAIDDFAGVVEFLRGQVPAERFRAAGTIAELSLLVSSEGWHPDLVVVLQSWPDQYSVEDVHRLLSHCPLARLVCCFGPWCDSDGRTRSIWPLAARIPLASARRRLARELALLQNVSSSPAPLPLTASRSEIFEFDFQSPPDNSRPETPSATVVKVIAPDRAFRQMLESAARSWSCDQRELLADGPREIILFDADPRDPERKASVREVRGSHPHSKLVACVGFPRP